MLIYSACDRMLDTSVDVETISFCHRCASEDAKSTTVHVWHVVLRRHGIEISTDGFLIMKFFCQLISLPTF